DNFRHYAMAAGDLNPLWVEGEHGRTGADGGVVAPPGWLSSVIRPAHSVRRVVPATCDVLDAEVQWRFYENVRLGDRVLARGRLVDVVRKTTQALGDCALASGVIEYTDAHGHLLASARSAIFIYPRDESRAGRRSGPLSSTAAAPEPATPVVRRGTQARYWDDLEVGQEIPPVRRQVLTEREIIQWFIGSHMWLLESSARHFSAAAAQQTSVPAAFDIGTQRTAWLAQLVTDWAGDDAQLVELTCRFRGLIFVGDAPELGGQVESLSEESGEHLARLGLWVKNGAGTTVSPATAVVRLPRRD
ncbi:MAG: MaoC family dehydratase N-terminal domain-containing protein, partial [Mycetocola sp.]